MHKIGNWQAWPIPKGGEHKRPSLEDSTGNTRDKRVVVADPQNRVLFLSKRALAKPWRTA